jgi:hypothetical protein
VGGDRWLLLTQEQIGHSLDYRRSRREGRSDHLMVLGRAVFSSEIDHLEVELRRVRRVGRETSTVFHSLFGKIEQRSD